MASPSISILTLLTLLTTTNALAIQIRQLPTSPLQPTPPTTTTAPPTAQQTTSAAPSPGMSAPALTGVILGGIALVLLTGMILLWHQRRTARAAPPSPPRGASVSSDESLKGVPEDGVLKRAAKRASGLVLGRPKHVGIDTRVYEERARREGLGIEGVS